MSGRSLQRRAQRALERQLDYQRGKAEALRGREAEVMADMAARSLSVRSEIEQLRPLPVDARVLEVGSGAHGLIFFFDCNRRVGVDPLAEEYRTLFSHWQTRAETVAAFGEHLPFDDAGFDVVLCDNVVDHAESPRKIVAEIARVLKPGGLLYFTVNVHHAFYHWAARAHSGWRALGIPFEIAPFADHTVHLTPVGARRLLAGQSLRILREHDDIEQAKRSWRDTPPRHMGDRLKRLFFKNACWEAIAEREAY